MNYWVYILLSKDCKHWYIGSSSNISNRLQNHNKGLARSTKSFLPWNLVYSEVYCSRSEAYKREMYLKSPAGYNNYLDIKKRIVGGVG